MKTASWVIIENVSGKAVLETFSSVVAEAINRNKYTVMPILQYLQSINLKLKENAPHTND